MMIVDIDKLFKAYVVDFLTKNKGKYNDSQLNDKLEDLYTDFAATPFKELDGHTPATFYVDKADKLVWILTEHFKVGVPVSDYLISAIKEVSPKEELLPLVSLSNPADLVLIALECLYAKDAKIDDNRLIDLFFDSNLDERIRDFIADHYLNDHSLKMAILDRAEGIDAPSGAVLDVLSTMEHSDRIRAVLERGFLSGLDKAPEYCQYLVRYFDESLLPALYRGIELCDDYISFKEISIAIEALGGTPPAQRDFSNDKNYLRIKESSKNEHKTNN